MAFEMKIAGLLLRASSSARCVCFTLDVFNPSVMREVVMAASSASIQCARVFHEHLRQSRVRSRGIRFSRNVSFLCFILASERMDLMFFCLTGMLLINNSGRKISDNMYLFTLRKKIRQSLTTLCKQILLYYLFSLVVQQL